jgi:hypothetical protein
MKGVVIGAITGLTLGVGCAMLAWLAIVENTGNEALAIGATVGTLIAGSYEVIQARARGRMRVYFIGINLLIGRAILYVGAIIGAIIGMVIWVGIDRISESSSGMTVNAIIGAGGGAVLGAILGQGEGANSR